MAARINDAIGAHPDTRVMQQRQETYSSTSVTATRSTAQPGIAVHVRDVLNVGPIVKMKAVRAVLNKYPDELGHIKTAGKGRTKEAILQDLQQWLDTIDDEDDGKRQETYFYYPSREPKSKGRLVKPVPYVLRGTLTDRERRLWELLTKNEMLELMAIDLPDFDIDRSKSKLKLQREWDKNGDPWAMLAVRIKYGEQQKALGHPEFHRMLRQLEWTSQM